MITKTQILQWLQVFATDIEQNKDYLTELDAAIGDADHGINMERGFKKVNAQLPSLADQNITNIFKTISMILISTIGGASGPLFGTFFLRASASVTNQQELSTQDLLKILQAGLEGIIQRGKAQVGDKTMIDALAPSIGALQQAIAEGYNVQEAMESAVTAAEQGMKDTIPMIAKKGRASYLGERSVGHQDPGATSVYLMLNSFLKVLQQ